MSPRRQGRRRCLGALGAGFVLMLAFTAPALGATSARVTTYPGPGTGPGYGGPPPGFGDPHGRGPILLALLEAFLRELRARQSGSQTTSTPTPPAKNPTPTTTPPTTVPVTTPPTTPPRGTPPTTAPPAATTPVTTPVAPTAVIATATPLATSAATTRSGGHTAARASAPAGLPGVSPPAGGVPSHPPQTRVSTPITRVLGSAPSYGLLFTLVGAVLAFLAVQSRVDRRDPRIARAPIDAYRDFRDFE